MEYLRGSLNTRQPDVEKKAGRLTLRDDTGAVAGGIMFFEAWPCKWKGFDLDGKGTDAVVEEIELSVESFVPERR